MAIIEVDRDLEKVVYFMGRNIPPQKLLSIAYALRHVADIFWTKHSKPNSFHAFSWEWQIEEAILSVADHELQPQDATAPRSAPAEP